MACVARNNARAMHAEIPDDCSSADFKGKQLMSVL